jgi:hypothetical protein
MNTIGFDSIGDFQQRLQNGVVTTASSIHDAGFAEHPRVLLADDHPANARANGRRPGRRMLRRQFSGQMDANYWLRRSGSILMSSCSTSPCRGSTVSKRRANFGARSGLRAWSSSRSTKMPTSPVPHSMRAGSAMSLRRGSLPTSYRPSGQRSLLTDSRRPPCASMNRDKLFPVPQIIQHYHAENNERKVNP